jgi:hypothetical protein
VSVDSVPIIAIYSRYEVWALAVLRIGGRNEVCFERFDCGGAARFRS